MDNDKKLFEELLKADGIDPKAPTESEREVFRKILDSEQKRFNRLAWRTNAAMWIYVLALLGLCIFGDSLERLGIPFIISFFVVVASAWFLLIRYGFRHNRKIMESNKKVSKLYYLVNGEHRGVPLVGIKNGKRHIYWLRIIMVIAGIWVIMPLGASGVYYLLCQRWMLSSIGAISLHVFYCTVASLLFVIIILRAGLKAPLDELTEIKTKPKRSTPVPRHDMWRIIMNSKMTKIAVAAVVIIGVMIGAYVTTGSFDGSSTALARAVENMKNMPWVHSSMEIDHSGQKTTADHWVCFDPSIIIIANSDGSIMYIHFGKNKMYEYKPDVSTITITPKTDEYNLPWPGSPVEIISVLLDQAREQNAEISSELTEMDGVSVEIIRMVSKDKDVTLVCDIERNLVMSMTTEAVISENSEKVTVHATFDYPDEGPQDIYALGAPEDAVIIDVVPKGDVEDLTDELKRRFDNGIGDHTAVILDSRIGDEGVLKPSMITIMRQKGKRKRCDRYYAFDSSGHKDGIVSLYENVKDRWPDFTVEDIEELVTDQAWNQMLFDGKKTHQRYIVSGQVQKQQTRTDLFKLIPMDSLAGTIWVNPQVVIMGHGDTDEVLKSLDTDADHAGLWGFRVIRTLSNNKDDGGYKPSPGTDDYWFDPEKDYMLVERITKNETGKKGGAAKIRTIVEEAGKTSDGKWYPVVIIKEHTHISPNGETRNSKKIKHVLIDVDKTLDLNLFDSKGLME